MTIRPVIHLKRAYVAPGNKDGCRVLVDRIWPRGIKKDDLDLDHWLKEIAPSAELRKWFGHRDERWEDFRRKYREELDQHSDEVDFLRNLCDKKTVTLVYAARDEDHNNAVVIKEYLGE